MNRPVWLLDIDGVLNAFGSDGAIAWTTGNVETSRVTVQAPRMTAPRPFTIRWAPELPARVRAIHDTGLVEIRWCTTWLHGDAVRAAEALFGLPELPAAYDPGVVSHRAAKLVAALAVLTGSRPLIWTDDDAIPWRGPDRDRLDDAAATGRALLIAPDEHAGLRPTDLNLIEAFITGSPG